MPSFFGGSTCYGPLIGLLAPKSGLCCLGWWRTWLLSTLRGCSFFQETAANMLPSLRDSTFFLPILLFQLQILPPPNYKQRVWPLIKDSVRTCLSLLCLVSLQIPGMRPASHFTNIEDNTHDSSCKAAATEKFHQVYSLEGLRHSPWKASRGMGEEEEK